MALSINVKELSTMLADDNVFLVDVREGFEHRREHISGAHLFPSSSLSVREVLQAAGKKTKVCVHCASGGRSATACDKLVDELRSSAGAYGDVTVYNVVGGMSAWRMAGLPVVENAKAPLPIIRQVHLIASTLIITGSLLSRFYHPNFAFLSLFVGCGLFLSGSTGFCGMALILQRLPYNR